MWQELDKDQNTFGIADRVVIDLYTMEDSSNLKQMCQIRELSLEADVLHQVIVPCN